MIGKLQKIREEVEKLHGNPYYMMAVKDVLAIIDSLQEEPVSEDLGEYINELSKQFQEVSFAKLSRIAVRVAKWQKEQFEKNRLAHCDAQTEEEAEIELDFVMSIIEKEHRQPTFDDAIKYGMRLQKEQMMKDAIDAELDDVCGFLTISVPYHNGIAGDKVKVIIIKGE